MLPALGVEMPPFGGQSLEAMACHNTFQQLAIRVSWLQLMGGPKISLIAVLTVFDCEPLQLGGIFMVSAHKCGSAVSPLSLPSNLA